MCKRREEEGKAKEKETRGGINMSVRKEMSIVQGALSCPVEYWSCTGEWGRVSQNIDNTENNEMGDSLGPRYKKKRKIKESVNLERERRRWAGAGDGGTYFANLARAQISRSGGRKGLF